MSPWSLKRTKQCAKCPWRRDVDPNEIPNGYCPTKHRKLERTIAREGDLSALLGKPHHVMACHEEHEAHCVGWLVHQMGAGNNIGLRLRMMSCTNARHIQTFGEQCETFEETLPENRLCQPKEERRD